MVNTDLNSMENNRDEKEDEKMSNYEKYACRHQPKLLAQTVSMDDCIKKLQKMKEVYSKEYIDDIETFVAMMFNRSICEIHDAVSGKEYWMC